MELGNGYGFALVRVKTFREEECVLERAKGNEQRDIRVFQTENIVRRKL